MKWFFAGLVVLNIALLAWNWQRTTGSEVVAANPAVAPAGKNGLRLLNELETMPEARPAVAPEAAEPAVEAEPQQEPSAEEVAIATVPQEEAQETAVTEQVAVPQLSCLRLASIESRAQAAEVVAGLKKAGVEGIREGSDMYSKKRYWVLLSPAKNAAATTAAIERLKQAGIKDFYLIRSGDNKNAISLGLFSNPDSAQRRMRQMRDLKFKPRIDESTVSTERRWIEFRWPQQRPESDWREGLPKAAQKLPASACP